MDLTKSSQLSFFLVLMLISSITSADTFNYNVVSLSYERFSENVDGLSKDVEGNGVNLELHYDVVERVGIIAGYTKGSGDVTSNGITLKAEVELVGVGAEYHAPVNSTMDGFVGALLIRSDGDVTVNGVKQPSRQIEGNQILLGVRSMVFENVELNGFINRTSLENEISTYFKVGSAIYIRNKMSLDIGYVVNDDGNSLLLGVSKYF